MNLTDQHCIHTTDALSAEGVAALLPEAAGWSVSGTTLRRTYGFKDYHETMAFVNALAWMTHREDHHPELTVTYNKVAVAYSTHSAGDALTRNDFICAAKVNALYAQRAGA